MELRVVVSELTDAAAVQADVAVGLAAAGRLVTGLDAAALGPALAPALAVVLDAAQVSLRELERRSDRTAAALRTTATEVDRADEQVAVALHGLLGLLAPPVPGPVGR